MFFEDFKPGDRFDAGAQEITREEILAFARQWDPQPFHLDEEAGRQTHFGGLVASGFHTLLIAFNLSLGSGTWAESSLGSPGMESLRWLRPVRPGDRLHVAVSVIDAVPSRSKPDRGVVTFDHAVTNQHGEVVMTYRTPVMLRRRTPGG